MRRSDKIPQINFTIVRPHLKTRELNDGGDDDFGGGRMGEGMYRHICAHCRSSVSMCRFDVSQFS